MHRCIGSRQGSMKSVELYRPPKSPQRVVSFRRETGRRFEELAFLPAALEIVETPPSPVGRTIGATLVVLFCGTGLGLVGHDRHRCLGDRKNRVEQP